MSKTSENSLKADIVVIGAGGAGLAAAVTAAEQGAGRIILLESRRVPGGNSVFAEGFFAITDSIKDPAEIRQLKDDLFRTTMSYTHHRADPRLLRAMLDEAADTFRWLTARGIGLEWRDDLQHSEVPLYASYVDPKIKAGAIIVKALAAECRERGIQVLGDTRARELVIGDSGRIEGVLAAANGEELRISAAAVVLASGGFAGSKRLLRKYFPAYTDDIRVVGVPHRGDGMRLAAAAGADTSDTFVLELEGPTFPWTRKLGGDFLENPYTVWVNGRGERYTEEFPNPFLGANALDRQPGKVSYTLLDEGIKQRIYGDLSKKDSGWSDRLEKLLRTHAEKGRIKITDSWEEIAAWMGVAPAKLQTTIQDYNSYCARGRDDLYGKDPAFLMPLTRPPYYAVLCYPSLLVTHGGIRISPETEVMDRSGRPIPGFYAAGVDTGGVDAGTYNYHLPGHSFGFALNTGRIAGREAVAGLKG